MFDRILDFYDTEKARFEEFMESYEWHEYPLKEKLIITFETWYSRTRIAIACIIIYILSVLQMIPVHIFNQGAKLPLWSQLLCVFGTLLFIAVMIVITWVDEVIDRRKIREKYPF